MPANKNSFFSASGAEDRNFKIILFFFKLAPGSHLNSGELFNLDFSKETENFKIDGKLLNYNNIRGFSCSAFCQIEVKFKK